MCLLLFWHLISGLKWSWRIKCCLISYTVSAPCLPCGVQNICLISDVGSGWGSSARQECFWNQPFSQFIFLLIPFLLSPLLPSCKNHVLWITFHQAFIPFVELLRFHVLSPGDILSWLPFLQSHTCCGILNQFCRIWVLVFCIYAEVGFYPMEHVC